MKKYQFIILLIALLLIAAALFEIANKKTENETQTEERLRVKRIQDSLDVLKLQEAYMSDPNTKPPAGY